MSVSIGGDRITDGHASGLAFVMETIENHGITSGAADPEIRLTS